MNLSQNSDLVEKMIEIEMIKVSMEMLYKPESSIRQLLVMLLVNLTQLDSGIASLLQVCCYFTDLFFSMYIYICNRNL